MMTGRSGFTLEKISGVVFDPYDFQDPHCSSRCVINDEFQGMPPATLDKNMGIDKEVVGALAPPIRGAHVPVVREIMLH